MMRPAIAGTLRQEFRDHAGEALFLRLQKMYVLDRERRLEEEQDKQAEADLEAFATAMASLSEIDDFKIELDRYDEATVAALDTNERALSVILKQQNVLLSKAHVLEDGRRVFKTEDGTAVFDETGMAVDAVTIAPDLIRNDRPTWESYKPVLEARERLQNERNQLHVYQAKLDGARERLDAGTVSHKEFEQLKLTLKEDMPDAVRENIPNLSKGPAGPSTNVISRGSELEFSADIVPAGVRQYLAPRTP